MTAWLSVREAAAVLGVSETTILRGVAKGAIPHIRPGGRYGSIRIPAEWLTHPSDPWTDNSTRATVTIG